MRWSSKMYKGVQNYHDRSFMPRIASKATIHVRTCDRSLKHIKGPKTISTKCLCGTSSPYTIDCILSCIVWICLKLIFKLKRAALHVTTFVQGNFSLNSFPTLHLCLLTSINPHSHNVDMWWTTSGMRYVKWGLHTWTCLCLEIRYVFLCASVE